MNHRILLFTIIILIGLLHHVEGQVQSQSSIALSDRPESKSDSLLVKDVSIEPGKNVVLLIAYRIGSGKNVQSVHFNNKRYTEYFKDVLSNGKHHQGIIALPIGDLKEAITSDLCMLLDSAASVRGAIVCSYTKVHQEKPFVVVTKRAIDTTNEIKIKTLGSDGNIVFDLLSAKIKGQSNVKASIGKYQEMLVPPRNIRPNPTKGSGLLMMASTSVLTKKPIPMSWSFPKDVLDVLYHSVIIQSDTTP